MQIVRETVDVARTRRLTSAAVLHFVVWLKKLKEASIISRSWNRVELFHSPPVCVVSFSCCKENHICLMCAANQVCLQTLCAEGRKTPRVSEERLAV